MKRIPLIFLGFFATLAVSWIGLVLSNQVSYGGLTPYFDAAESRVHPEPAPGVAARGKLVYQEMGCVHCHTQQVRRPGFGADQARGWGERQSVPREYIREERVVLGSNRIGPDLRNVGARIVDPIWHYLHLYDPQLTSPGSLMAPHPFLFEQREIVGEPSSHALALPASHALPDGYELVPTERARMLVAYLLSLKDTFAYPETTNVYAEPEADTEAADGAEETN